ncbi:MAG: DUF1987 domain-containing protein [Salinivirgaceae bacterium]|nr:DUF1987 domain-containing protein [Salinivirgaceae bacterium]MDD4747246.1 DUF1987 domain-containing protein [Salinivirgaceae bacterium]MDY0280727.1 DUF1987 domain-containing protein [Salinivirgaceae bacterium]
MNNLLREKTHTTPEIYFDAKTGVFEIQGRSIPENAMKIYRPVMEWIEQYLVNPQPKTTINLRLSFFNTSTSKYLMEMLKKFEVVNRQGYPVEVFWYYDDEDIRDIAEDYQALVDVPMKMILSTNNMASNE